MSHRFNSTILALAALVAGCASAQGVSPASYPDLKEEPECTFEAGAMPKDTNLDAKKIDALRKYIKYVIVIVQENRSMDNLFAFTDVPGIEKVPKNDPARKLLMPMSGIPADPPHDWYSMARIQKSCETTAFPTGGSYLYTTDRDHPFYTWLAKTFATSDRFFSSVLGPTWPNRQYLTMGTSWGNKHTSQGHPYVDKYVDVFDQLDAQANDWELDNPDLGQKVRNELSDDFRATKYGWVVKNGANSRHKNGLYNHPMEDAEGTHFNEGHPGGVDWGTFMTQLSSGTDLKPLMFVDLGPPDDEHPNPDKGQSVYDGERAVRELLVAAMAGKAWKDMAIFLTYDESGGFYDHVCPPKACVPDDLEDNKEFTRLGFRIPFYLVSPYAKPGYVSHNVHSHTSILRFIQALHDLPALTKRDANSDALLDLFHNPDEVLPLKLLHIGMSAPPATTKTGNAPSTPVPPPPDDDPSDIPH